MHDNRVPLMPGNIIKNGTSTYEVLEHLGFGGSSLVYLCKCNDMAVAVKELYPKELEFSLQRDTNGNLSFAEGMNTQHAQDAFRWHKRNMRSEASLHSEAAHARNMLNNDPFFVGCEGVFDYNGTTYCVYQTADGKSLKDFVAERQNSCAPDAFLAELLSIIAITAKKLHCIHQAGLLHLDISPSNIYMIDHGNGVVPYLLDFGSACRVSEDVALTGHRFSVTNGFSAPELYCRSEGNHTGYPVTAATDTYGVVAILFWALCGQTYRDCLLCTEVWENTIKGKYSYAEMVLQILNKGLGEQRNRYQSATELCDDLLQVLALLQGDTSRTKEIIAQINLQLNSYTQELKDTIRNSAAFITDHIDESKAEVKQEIRRSKKHIVWCGVGLVVLAVSFLAWLMLGDFSPPSVSLIGVKKDPDGYICVERNTLTFCFEYTDDKGLDWQKVNEGDILLDGFTAEKDFEEYHDGFYKLTLTNIKTIDNNSSIVVKGGCAKDTSGKRSNEERFYLRMYYDAIDTTIPTTSISRPVGKNGSNIIKQGESISFELFFDDERQFATANISTEYIRACSFSYDEMISYIKGDGWYAITFTNVQGTNGEHRIYVAPGTAVDHANNYSKGVESYPFYLCESEKEIDTIPPQVSVSNGIIQGNLVEYKITASDNMNLSTFSLKPASITLVGFEADVKVDFNSIDGTRTIRFANIQMTSDDPYFILDSGLAVDAFGNRSSAEVIFFNTNQE